MIPTQLGNVDPAQSGYWSVRESFVSFVLTNMPMVYPLVKRFFEKSFSSLGVGSKGRTTGKGDSNGYKLGSTARIRDHRAGAAEAGTKQHPLSTPGNGTRWGSEENIVYSDDDGGADVKTVGTTNSTGGDDATPSPLPLQGVRHESAVAIRAGGGHDRDAPGGDVERGLPGILVTHEYTVTKTQERRRKDGRVFGF